MRFAWIEYEHPGDGVMLAAGLAAQGWKNPFEDLLPDPGNSNKRLVKNAPPPAIHANVEKIAWSGSRAWICVPTNSDSEEYLGKWVLNPGIKATGELTFESANADAQADLVCVSGHGAGGVVWGSRTGTHVEINLARETKKNAAMAATGNVKYLIISSCNNVADFNARKWEPIMHKVNPIHGILGYEDSYAGDGVGAAVMQTFARLLKVKGKTILQAWKEANTSHSQPWAALVQAVSENNTLADWVAGKLPAPLPGGDLKRFGKSDPNGTVLSFGVKPYTAAWRMADGTVIESTNLSDPAVGLIPGQKGALILKKATGTFAVGDELTLLVYLYRPSHPMNLDELIELDPSLLAPSPPPFATVTVTTLRGANPKAKNVPNVDGLRVKILKAVASVELPYTVRKTAHTKFKQDGPQHSWGFFWIGLYPPGTAPNPERTGEIEQGATGALLR